jgi:hypothetical protein
VRTRARFRYQGPAETRSPSLSAPAIGLSTSAVVREVYHRVVPHECPHHGLPALGHAECYAGLKDAFRAGAYLAADELSFIGFGDPVLSRDGWHDASAVVPTFELGGHLSEEDSALLGVLMGTERAGLEFLA